MDNCFGDDLQSAFIEPSHSTKVQLGIALSARGYQMKRDADLRRYYAIPRIKAA